MYSVVKNGAFILLVGFLAACSSTDELELSSFQTGLYLSIQAEAKREWSEPDQVSIMETRVEQPSYLLKENRTILASKAGEILVISAQDIAEYKARGYRLENEQLVTAFGKTPAESYAELLQYEKLWQFSQGEGLTIALIDSGLSPDHMHLGGTLLHGYDFVADREGSADESGHGTAVASLIVGQGMMPGIAPKATLLPLKVLDKNNQGSSLDLIRALYYAADLLPDLRNPNKADIVNVSLGSTSYSPAMHEAIKSLRQAGILVVAAVGNEPGKVAFPAALAEVIAVGAADMSFARWHLSPYSGFGKALDILVPMTGVITAQGENKFFNPFASGLQNDFIGTSFAAPQVSGLLALLLAQGISGDAAVTALELSSSDLFELGKDKDSGFGLFDPYAALRSTNSAAMIKARYAVQVLDAKSLQEVYFSYSETERFIPLLPGDYHLVVWQDLNQDGLWDRMQEAVYQTITHDALSILAGESLELEINLY